MSQLIESNIPEGTLWPDLDDSAQIHAECMRALLDETYSRPFEALKKVDLSYTAQAQVFCDVRRYYPDPFASQSIGQSSPFDSFMTRLQ